MSWRILLDQGLPRSAVDYLGPHGLDVVHTGDIGMWAAEDEVILQHAACRGSDCCDAGCGFPSFDGFIRGNTTVSDPHSHSGAARRGTFPTPTGGAPKLCRRPGQWFARLGPGRGYPLAEAASSTSDPGRSELSASSSITIIQTAPGLPPWRRRDAVFGDGEAPGEVGLAVPADLEAGGNPDVLVDDRAADAGVAADHDAVEQDRVLDQGVAVAPARPARRCCDRPALPR